MKLELISEGMTCEGCVRHVTRAVKKVDPKAEVSVELSSQRIQVKSDLPAGESQKKFEAAIEEAGYPVRKSSSLG